MYQPIPRKIEFSRNRTLARKIAALLPRNYSLVLPYLPLPLYLSRSISICLYLSFSFFFLIKHHVLPRSLYVASELCATPRRVAPRAAAGKKFQQDGFTAALRQHPDFTISVDSALDKARGESYTEFLCANVAGDAEFHSRSILRDSFSN